ncbi:unnamed protein product [Prorocentrum cordatum]|uniref:Major facilitator superfamily (MFS) profile domain-containing protein n=1 Tax=Prorocentrum cordatum TaxID=2364126 RepID=A0ABN9TZG1_9DINO|nr:unnamed protein product [Polarella glacialis]
MACFNAAQFVGAPVIGRISDARGRRRVLLGVFFWTSLCFAATCFVHSFEELLVVRALAGLSGGSIVVSTAMIMDASTSAERPQQLGVLGGILGVAFTIGPGLVTLALYLREVDRRWVFASASALAFGGACVGCCILQETLGPDRRAPLCEVRGADSSPLGKFTVELGEIYSHGLGCIWMGRFWASLSFLCLFATYAFLIHDAFGWGDREFGVILAMSGIGEAVIEYFVYPWLSETLGKHAVFAAGLVSGGVRGPPPPSGPWPRGPCRCTPWAWRSSWPAAASPTRGYRTSWGRTPPRTDRMGFAQGLTGVFRSLASVAAPLVAGRAYDSSGPVARVRDRRGRGAAERGFRGPRCPRGRRAPRGARRGGGAEAPAAQEAGRGLARRAAGRCGGGRAASVRACSAELCIQGDRRGVRK